MYQQLTNTVEQVGDGLSFLVVPLECIHWPLSSLARRATDEVDRYSNDLMFTCQDPSYRSSRIISEITLRFAHVQGGTSMKRLLDPTRSTWTQEVVARILAIDPIDLWP